MVWIEQHKVRLPNLKNECYIFEVFAVLPKKIALLKSKDWLIATLIINIYIYNPSSVPLSRKWRDWNPHGTQNNPNRCLQRETHHTLRKHTEKSNYWRDWNSHGTQNNLNRCLQRETHHTSRSALEISNYWRDWNPQGTPNNLNRCLQGERHHTSRKRTGNIKLLERLEPTRNPKQPESMLAKGNTSHIKKTHWKYQTTEETGTHTEPKTTWIDACKGKHITSRKRTGNIKLLERLEPTRNPKQPESMLAKGNTSHIKKTHWKYQTNGETGTHAEPQTTWIDACKGKHITHQENALEKSNNLTT